MPSPFWKKFVIAATALTLVIGVVSLNSIGQETKKADTKAKAGAKTKGRLPAYYRDFVTEEQKDQIYVIQAKYEKQIGDLQGQLDAVRAKQNGEIEALLSAEQKEKLAKAKADADAKKKAGKRGGGGDKKVTEETKPAEAKTTTESAKTK